MFYFADIPGHTTIKAMLLRNGKAGHIPHAQLFTSPEGGAALHFALTYAMYINCTDKQEEGSCGACASCVKYKKLVHPDLHLIFPTIKTDKIDAKSDNYLAAWRKFVLENPYGSLTQWLQAINGTDKAPIINAKEGREVIEKLSLKAFEAEYKVMLIWKPEFLNVQAANALLKILEEPPAKTVFLLVANEPQKLLATILSRCQTVHIPAFSDEEIAAYLQEKHSDITAEKAHVIALSAEGNLQKAIALLQNSPDDYNDFFVQWMRNCYSRKYNELIKAAEQFADWNKTYQKNFIHYALATLRQALIAHGTEVLLQRLPAPQREFVQKFSKTLSIQQIEKITQYINTAGYQLDQNANEKILFLDVSIEISYVFAQK